MKQSFYPIVQIGFVLLTLVYLFFFIRMFRQGLAATSWEPTRKKRFGFRLIILPLIWVLLISIWSASGRMSEFSIFPLNFMPVILFPMIVAVVWVSSSQVSEILQHIPPANIIQLQSFRFFVEILLWLLFIENRVPVQMTFEGRNFDILAGISAPVIAYLASHGKISRGALIFWNVVCLGLLLNIVITAILSTPSPWRVFMNEPANYVVTYFPVSWLPGFLVPLAYYLHFLSLKQLLRMPNSVSTEKV